MPIRSSLRNRSIASCLLIIRIKFLEVPKYSVLRRIARISACPHTPAQKAGNGCSPSGSGGEGRLGEPPSSPPPLQRLSRAPRRAEQMCLSCVPLRPALDHGEPPLRRQTYPSR